MEYGYAWVGNWRHYLRFPLNLELAEIIDKLLQKEIQDRYQSADEVIRDLMKKHTHILPAANHTIIESPGKNFNGTIASFAFGIAYGNNRWVATGAGLNLTSSIDPTTILYTSDPTAAC